MFKSTDLIFNGQNFGDLLYVESVQRQLVGERKHNVLRIPGRPGFLHRSTEIGEKKIIVNVRIIETDRAAVMSKAHTIAGMLHTEVPAKLYTRGDTLYDLAVLDGDVDIEQLFSTGHCELEFVNHSGLQYGADVSNGIVNGTPITVQGTYKTRGVFVITLSASATGLTLTNTTTGQSVKLTGNYVSGNIITIDCENESIKLGANLVMSHIDNSITRFFDLVPGSNTLTTTAGTVSLTYTPRYI